MGAPGGDRTLAETMKRRQYYKRTIKRHYGGELAGLAHNQLFSQRGLRGTTLGPAAGSMPPRARRASKKCGTAGSDLR